MHFTLSIALSKILPHSKTIKNAKKLSVFGENDSHHLSNFLRTHIFWNIGHIPRIYNQIFDCRFQIFKKIVLFFNVFFPKKTCTLMPLRGLLSLGLAFSQARYSLVATWSGKTVDTGEGQGEPDLPPPPPPFFGHKNFFVGKIGTHNFFK